MNMLLSWRFWLPMAASYAYVALMPYHDSSTLGLIVALFIGVAAARCGMAQHEAHVEREIALACKRLRELMQTMESLLAAARREEDKQ